MTLRLLEQNDYNLGYLELLEQLTDVGKVPYSAEFKAHPKGGVSVNFDTMEPELDAKISHPLGVAKFRHSTVPIEEWNNRYNEIALNPCIQVWVMVENDTIVSSGTLILEPKFIHNNGRVAHIEDVVVHKDKRGLGFGKKLLDALVDVSKNNGCYKVILNCSNKNIGFYEKLGFIQKEIQMAHYFTVECQS